MYAADAPASRPIELPAVEAGVRPAPAERVAAYIELTKPGIVRMVVLTAAAGFLLAAGSTIDPLLLLHALIGISLAASGSCGLNEYIERGADARMRRTLSRPLPSSRLTPRRAAWFSTTIAVAGVIYCALFVNMATAALVALSLVTYVAVYTPLKRLTWWATIVGAVPGALPILAGWTAGGGTLDSRGLTLFGILFLWQMPHFYALAWLYREDYQRGGFRLITSLDNANVRLARQVLGFSVVLFLASVLPTALGLTGPMYLLAAVTLGAAFLLLATRMSLRQDDRRARQLFLGSVVYLPALLVLMVVDSLLL